MSKNFEVNTKMDFLSYVRTVDEIVSEYFDANGDYCPHIGRAYVMQLFYNLCVNSEELDSKINGDMNAIEIVNILASHDKFVRAFNNAIYPLFDDCVFSFANAYRDAMEIIDDKRSSIGRAVDTMKNALDSLLDNISSAITDENLSAINAITKNMTDGRSTIKAIVEEYSNSDAFKKILKIKNEDQGE